MIKKLYLVNEPCQPGFMQMIIFLNGNFCRIVLNFLDQCRIYLCSLEIALARAARGGVLFLTEIPREPLFEL